MHPLEVARQAPEKLAIVETNTGRTLTYSELVAQINQIRRLFADLGLRRGDHIAVLLPNCSEFLEVCWAAQLSGLYYTPISRYLGAQEAGYIVNDCGASVFIASTQCDTSSAIVDRISREVQHRFILHGDLPGYMAWASSLEKAKNAQPGELSEGQPMLYSSGTTGRPKGVKQALRPEREIGGGLATTALSELFGFDDETSYLSPAPLYHAAPLFATMAVHRMGGTTYISKRFDAHDCLNNIERYKVTHSQFVPTMFVRMLRLGKTVRDAFNLTSLRVAIHAAAPCPIHVKEQMIDWWGPILLEYYAGTESNGLCALSSIDWLTHKGSVGRALLGTVRIVGESGDELPIGESGTVYFEGGPKFEYHNDPDKTASTRLSNGWSTMGDIGYLDEEGYLYLVDRKAFTIISGGVNVYPQEIEDVLMQHEAVADVAVFGVPNTEFGEEVKAVVELRDNKAANAQLESDLIQFCRSNLSSIKVPRSIDFRDALPRSEAGKLYKKALKDEYWSDS